MFKLLFLSAIVVTVILVNTVDKCESAPVDDDHHHHPEPLDTWGCPITSKCKSHCQSLGFKDGKCEGATHTTCHCIG
ncbi:putative potassium channel toxin Ts21 [Oppia nitens]|uniref:putative potassium channel toxin Ts21 n=1 Tax=Oppia nitens TaxID=1686743 RepID=UPI0023DCD14A|nr:putative potassium channel toxin Ts21 [Oppia nitens]